MLPIRLRGIDGGPVSPQELEDRWEIQSLPWIQQKCLRSLFYFDMFGVLYILIGMSVKKLDVYLTCISPTHSICRVFSQCEEARTVLLRRWLPEVWAANNKILLGIFVQKMTTFWFSSLSRKWHNFGLHLWASNPLQVAMIFVKQKKAWASLVPRSP